MIDKSFRSCICIGYIERIWYIINHRNARLIRHIIDQRDVRLMVHDHIHIPKTSPSHLMTSNQSHQQPPSPQYQRRRPRTNPPISQSQHHPSFQPPLPPPHPKQRNRKTHINHCSVLNLTPSTLSLNPATSCSILVSVSLIFNSCPLASSLILPFSRFRSKRTEAWVRPISSRRRALSLERSFVRRSWEARVVSDSRESRERSSERSLAKSTFCV